MFGWNIWNSHGVIAMKDQERKGGFCEVFAIEHLQDQGG